jgi:hypothetical protein
MEDTEEWFGDMDSRSRSGREVETEMATMGLMYSPANRKCQSDRLRKIHGRLRWCDHGSEQVENAVIDLEKWIWALLEMA